MSRHTPLYAVHQELGASFTDFAGWSMPVRYTSDVAEHHAVRTTSGLFDLSHMGELELTGPQAGHALDYALVGHPSKIAVGRARYSMLCTETGGIVDDLVVYRLADEHFLVVANAGNVPAVHAALQERTTSYDCQLRNTSDDWSLLAIQGPDSESVVGKLTEIPVQQLRYYAITAGTVAGCNVLLARTGYTGEDGFEIYCRPADAQRVWTTISAVPDGPRPTGLACRDTLRLEAGMPLYGHELSTEITPFEAGLGRIVAFGKENGFVGRDALARRRDDGPARILVGLVSDSRRSPRAGYAVLDPTGEPVGTVTSGAPSPTLRRPIAMAYVRPGLEEPGTPLLVDIRGRHEPVEVITLPFYRR
ncbi:glycine cleavage system aminomethyltransferase GcvT [Kribbella sp. NPDC004875]|uniref:glycine cleavage system aminomethyltransferase GcvT n=1 Tax=Kribbella sp. NPDC004875 TaxID=3364107 RepID=UPI0036C1BA0E